MHIKPIDRDMKKILESGFYKIPRFQRPYSWELEHLDDFWNDTVAGDGVDYFIGSMVLHKKNESDDLNYVVDGQQRLTTTTIFLAALRNSFLRLENNKLAMAVQKLIEREDINGEPTFILQAETPYPYLHEGIQSLGAFDKAFEIGPEERHIHRAFEYFTKSIDSIVRSIQNDKSILSEKKPDIIIKRLCDIRDRVLRLQVIIIELYNEDEAYIIFETLNTRGKDLEVADLVKNFLMKSLGPKNRKLDVAKDNWNGIRSQFAESAADIDINNFLLHYWLSCQDYVAEKKLFKMIKNTIKKKDAENFLNDLVKSSKEYRLIFEPEFGDWSKEEERVKQSLLALTLFRVRQNVPMVMSILREYKDKKIKLKPVASMLSSIESFHFIFTAITSQRSSGGISQMYSSAARNLLSLPDSNAKVRFLGQFVEKLRERIPAYEEFEVNFKEKYYSDQYTKEKPLVRYILEQMHRNEYAGPPIDYSKMTVEHLSPQNPDHVTNVSNEEVAMIGNLILIDGELNSKIGNKKFLEKKKALKKNGYTLDPILEDAEKWEGHEIVKRTEHLAGQAFRTVWKI